MDLAAMWAARQRVREPPPPQAPPPVAQSSNGAQKELAKPLPMKLEGAVKRHNDLDAAVRMMLDNGWEVTRFLPRKAQDAPIQGSTEHEDG